MKVTHENVVRLIARLLERGYGARCEPKKSFEWLAAMPRLEPDSPLAGIYRALTGREWRNGLRGRCGPRTVDAWFGPPLNLIFEFDEDRHFNAWRERTLGFYPAAAPLSFSVRVYLELCRERRPTRGGALARSAPPLFPGRDGRRRQQAFRDAVVDLLPPARGLNPTLRMAQAELVDSPRQELREHELESRLAKLLDERVALRANTTFLHMLRHPSAKPWVPTLFGKPG